MKGVFVRDCFVFKSFCKYMLVISEVRVNKKNNKMERWDIVFIKVDCSCYISFFRIFW